MSDKAAIATILAEVQALWSQEKFNDALAKMRSLYLTSPNDPVIAYQMGHLLGECSSLADTAIQTSLRDEAITVLTKLCNNMDGLDPIEQWKIRRHFFQYSGQHERNIALGHEEIARGNPLGVLSIGFGSLHHALNMIESDRLSEAQSFAKKGAEAFQSLLSIDPPKYGRYLAYALTLAILGREQEAKNATQAAAKLLHKSMDELKDHNTELNRLLAKARTIAF